MIQVASIVHRFVPRRAGLLLVALLASLTLTGCAGDGSVSLFDGKTLGQWKKTNFGGQGEVEIEDGMIVLNYGNELTGVHWGGEGVILKDNYEITLEAQRIDGTDFFCGLTFPVKDKHLTLVIGGWGGGLCGISALDGMLAADNETGTSLDFENKRWYAIRLMVTSKRLRAWIDKNEIVDVEIDGRELSLHPSIEPSVPLGISSFSTTAGIRNIRLRPLKPGEIDKAGKSEGSDGAGSGAQASGETGDEEIPCPCTQNEDAAGEQPADKP